MSFVKTLLLKEVFPVAHWDNINKGYKIGIQNTKALAPLWHK